MATANFIDLDYEIPLVVGGMESFEEKKEQWHECFDEEYTTSQYYCDLEDEFDIATEIAENFTKNLKYHTVEVISGYYSGFQFFVKEKYERDFDLDKSSKYCIDNDEAHYYFNECKSIAIRNADREKRKIRKWLESLENEGYMILLCIGRFSNGEAVYEKRNKRTVLLSAMNG